MVLTGPKWMKPKWHKVQMAGIAYHLVPQVVLAGPKWHRASATGLEDP